ncbi:MAG TPA: very short patch repair endonuclease [Phenylobacterium sp.]|uniref:very short patch repair endonuclease n=1 Tax=Phenylobacterium sp. TaxID=1871053 RepID=UPI002F9514DC
MDIVDPETRSRMMSRIRGKDTRPELAIRRALHAAGLRYRLQARTLPGRPDIVLPRHRAVVFVHGCFWHRHDSCRYATTPTTRPEFWAAKFEGNIRRDAEVAKALLSGGWRVATVWECGTRTALAEVVSDLLAWIRSDEAVTDLPRRRA